MNRFEQLHALLDQKPRANLGFFPTPLVRLDRLSEQLGVNLYVKRDDFSGMSLFGGNKIRKLEYLLGDAKEKGCDTVFTYGATQSNHAMLTAACASRLGMRAVLVLKKRGELAGGNQILNKIFGAEVCFVDTDSYEDVYAQMHRMMEQEQQQGHTPYFIPVGGSVPLGSLGYVNCAHEIAQQAEQMNVHFDSIVSATGSGGTYAGLTYGAKLYMPSTRSVGIGVCDDPFEEISYDLMCGIQELLESDVPVEKKDIHMHFHIGPGYAIPSEEGCAAVRRLARAEGILMDPVYTGKALAGFFQLLEEGYFDQDENILLLHSGGAGALFAVDLLAE